MANIEKGAYNSNRNVDRLTPREQQIWAMYQEGKGPTEIGKIIGIKAVSVSRNLTNIKEKVSTNG